MTKRIFTNRFVMGLPNILATWQNRVALRHALEEMLTTNPHLIEDIGMTKQEAEAEIAKHFWQE